MLLEESRSRPAATSRVGVGALNAHAWAEVRGEQLGELGGIVRERGLAPHEARGAELLDGAAAGELDGLTFETQVGQLEAIVGVRVGELRRRIGDSARSRPLRIARASKWEADWWRRRRRGPA